MAASRACLRILSMAALSLMVEREIPLPYGRARNPSPLWSSEKSLSLMVEREIPLPYGRAPTGPHHRNGEPLPGLSLTVEPLPVLTIGMVSPYRASPLPLLNSRAPKGP